MNVRNVCLDEEVEEGGGLGADDGVRQVAVAQDLEAEVAAVAGVGPAEKGLRVGVDEVAQRREQRAEQRHAGLALEQQPERPEQTFLRAAVDVLLDTHRARHTHTHTHTHTHGAVVPCHVLLGLLLEFEMKVEHEFIGDVEHRESQLALQMRLL